MGKVDLAFTLQQFAVGVAGVMTLAMRYNLNGEIVLETGIGSLGTRTFSLPYCIQGCRNFQAGQRRCVDCAPGTTLENGGGAHDGRVRQSRGYAG